MNKLSDLQQIALYDSLYCSECCYEITDRMWYQTTISGIPICQNCVDLEELKKANHLKNGDYARHVR